MPHRDSLARPGPARAGAAFAPDTLAGAGALAVLVAAAHAAPLAGAEAGLAGLPLASRATPTTADGGLPQGTAPLPDGAAAEAGLPHAHGAPMAAAAGALPQTIPRRRAVR